MPTPSLGTRLAAAKPFLGMMGIGVSLINEIQDKKEKICIVIIIWYSLLLYNLFQIDGYSQLEREIFSHRIKTTGHACDIGHFKNVEKH